MVVCRSEICATIAEISSIAATAAVVSPWIASTRRAMSSVAFAVSWASSLTSLATTAKPLPASPARAASIVAFSASRLVCSAMLVITLTTLPISAEDSPSFATVAVVRLRGGHRAGGDLRWPPRRSMAISRIEAPICSAPAATVCTLRRHLLGGAGDDTGLRGGLLGRRPRSAPSDAESSSEDAATASAEPTTPASTSRRLACASIEGGGHAADLVVLVDAARAGSGRRRPSPRPATVTAVERPHDPADHRPSAMPQHRERAEHDDRDDQSRVVLRLLRIRVGDRLRPRASRPTTAACGSGR